MVYQAKKRPAAEQQTAETQETPAQPETVVEQTSKPAPEERKSTKPKRENKAAASEPVATSPDSDVLA